MRDSLGASRKDIVPNCRLLALLLALPLLVADCSSKHANTPHSSLARSSPEDTTPDTAGCEMVAQVQHPQPGPLLAEFLRRDSAGEFTSTNSWAAAAALCPGHEAGWDTYSIVTGYELLPLRSTADTIRYQVIYHVYAEAVDDSLHDIHRVQKPEADTFAVVRTPYGWRLALPDIPPHVSPAATLRIMQIKQSDRAALAHLTPMR